MKRQELINYCLTLQNVYENYPFADVNTNNTWTVMRHCANKKSFVLIYERNGKLCVNLKCDRFEAEFLRQMFKDIVPGYHMNKEHWNTIIIGGDVPQEELKQQIRKSYDLTKPKLTVRALKGKT